MAITTFYKLPKLQKFPPVSLARPKTRPVGITVFASKEANGRDNYGGRRVDEDMLVLRVRIRELKMLESHGQPPQDWMEWEKQYFQHYKEDVYQAIGLLQNYLLSLRPSLVLGFMVLAALSITVSFGLLFFYVVEIIKQILST